MANPDRQLDFVRERRGRANFYLGNLKLKRGMIADCEAKRNFAQKELFTFDCFEDFDQCFHSLFWFTNKVAKARKMRKPPGTLGLKKFGPGRLRVKKIGPKILLLTFSLIWTILRK